MYQPINLFLSIDYSRGEIRFLDTTHGYGHLEPRHGLIHFEFKQVQVYTYLQIKLILSQNMVEQLNSNYKTNGGDASRNDNSQLVNMPSTQQNSYNTANQDIQSNQVRTSRKSVMEIIQQQKEWEVGKDYEIRKAQIGIGSYGKVCEAYHVPSGTRVAIKKILNLFEDAVDSKRLLREIQILKQLDNQHVVKLYDILEPADLRNYKSLYLVLEYAQSDLKKLLKSNQFLTELHVKTIFYNLLCGVKYMHSAKILHRDFKPANILINEDCTIKICDFGLARSLAGVKGAQGILQEEYDKYLEERKSSSKESPQDVGMMIQSDNPYLQHLQDKPELIPSPSKTLDEILTQPTKCEDKKSILTGLLSKTKDQRKNMARQLTGHVVTRWYRSPELILLEKDYGEPIDVWSIGCIFAELLTMMKENVPNPIERKALFPGSSCFPLSPDQNANLKRGGFPVTVNDQLNVIFEIIGTPTEDETSFVTDQKAIDYLKAFPYKGRADLSKNYPGIGYEAIDLLNKMLVFNPYFRPSIDEILEHPYLSNVKNASSEALAPLEVYLDVETVPEITLYKLKELFQKEIIQYRELRQEGKTYLQLQQKSANLK